MGQKQAYLDLREALQAGLKKLLSTNLSLSSLPLTPQSLTALLSIAEQSGCPKLPGQAHIA
jgi:hypothetical protein